MKTKRWTKVVAVTLFLGLAALPAVGLGPVAHAAPAGTQTVALAEGQKLALQDGSFLTVKGGQLTLVSRTGAAKVLPKGTEVFQGSKGQVGIWGTSGTTIVGTRSFDDPLLRTKPQGFDDPLLRTSAGTVETKGAYIDPALPRTAETKGAYIDPALPKAPPK